jgi:hypothetical protein
MTVFVITPISSDLLATYENRALLVRDVRYSRHKVRFEHGPPSDTSVGGSFSQVIAILPTIEALSTHSLRNAKSLDMATLKPWGATSSSPVYPDSRPGPLPEPV